MHLLKRFKHSRQLSLHLLLFVLTLLSTTLAGAEWLTAKPLFLLPFSEWLSWSTLKSGLAFSLPFLAVLTVHEFGHYFAARHHRVQVTLPYYIPFYLGFISTVGTLGAFIRIKSRVFSRTEFFDIGLAGPLAGFLVAVPLLWYGFTHLPPAEYIFTIHPEYKQFGLDYAAHVYKQGGNLALGKNLLFWIFEKTLVTDAARMPNPYELVHYPFLFAGFLALFFTALNLLPIGQLDGGHIGYAMLGFERFNRMAGVVFVLFITLAGVGMLSADFINEEAWPYALLYLGYLFVVLRKVVPRWKHTILLVTGVLVTQVLLNFILPEFRGYPGWLVFGLVLSRMVGVYHPPAPNEEPLTLWRKCLGMFALLMLILCFSPAPFTFD